MTASEAWPDRPAEPAALSGQELLSACAVLAACFSSPAGDAGTPDPDQAERDAIAACLDPTTHGSEERVIPVFDSNERWSYQVRTVLAKKGCAGVLDARTPLPTGITCQEDGCWWPGPNPPSVTCQGDVATLRTSDATFTRDCSHAYTHCSASSPTGCTDRAPIACDPASNDRCDGNIKLGCDRCGMVSFHDCAAQGGTCVERDSGASCLYAGVTGCATSNPTCAGTQLTACAGGRDTTVDCVALGLAGCASGHCVKP